MKINDFDHAILANTTLRFSQTSKKGGGTLRWMVRIYTSPGICFIYTPQAPELLKLVSGETNVTPTRNKQTDMYALGMVCQS